VHDNVLLTASFFGINTKTIRCLASVTWSHEVTELVLSEKVLNLSRRKITEHRITRCVAARLRLTHGTSLRKSEFGSRPTHNIAHISRTCLAENVCNYRYCVLIITQHSRCQEASRFLLETV